MLALCFMLSSPYYAENYAGIIDISLSMCLYVYTVYVSILSMGLCILSIRLPYEWHIWRTLSLAVWEGKQIDGYLVWQISSFIVRIN